MVWYTYVPVSEWSDDQSVSVAQVLVAKLELGVTDVDVTVSGLIIPAMTQLGEPCKSLTCCHLKDTHVNTNRQAFLTKQMYATLTF